VNILKRFMGCGCLLLLVALGLLGMAFSWLVANP
jgi:high-affinity Fe2+/Pb2+ permease